MRYETNHGQVPVRLQEGPRLFDGGMTVSLRRVAAVSVTPEHTLSKQTQAEIELVEGLGVAGDSHMGETVQHRSRVAKNPLLPNLRQVHLIHEELIDELRARGFAVFPGALGENITTRGVALLDLPAGTRMRIGASAVIELTGLRNPCNQLNTFQAGLMDAVIDRDDAGNLVRKAGVMGVVAAGGRVGPGDDIRIDLPAAPCRPLEPV